MWEFIHIRPQKFILTRPPRRSWMAPGSSSPPPSTPPARRRGGTLPPASPNAQREDDLLASLSKFHGKYSGAKVNHQHAFLENLTHKRGMLLMSPGGDDSGGGGHVGSKAGQAWVDAATLARAWRRWSRHHCKAKSMQRSIKHALQLALTRALVSWVAELTSRDDAACAMERAAAHLVRSGLARAWHCWRCRTEERNNVRRSVAHSLHRDLSVGWLAWMDLVVGQLRAATIRDLVLTHWSSRGLSRAWVQWASTTVARTAPDTAPAPAARPPPVSIADGDLPVHEPNEQRAAPGSGVKQRDNDDAASVGDPEYEDDPDDPSTMLCLSFWGAVGVVGLLIALFRHFHDHNDDRDRSPLAQYFAPHRRRPELDLAAWMPSDRPPSLWRRILPALAIVSALVVAVGAVLILASSCKQMLTLGAWGDLRGRIASLFDACVDVAKTTAEPPSPSDLEEGAALIRDVSEVAAGTPTKPATAVPSKPKSERNGAAAATSRPRASTPSRTSSPETRGGGSPTKRVVTSPSTKSVADGSPTSDVLNRSVLRPPWRPTPKSSNAFGNAPPLKAMM